MHAEVRGRKLWWNCSVRSTPLGWFRGLMFSLPLEQRDGLLLMFPSKRRIDVHMLFVLFPLDILWITKNGKIVKIARRVKPFTPFLKGTEALSVLEARAGAADGLRKGDFLTIKLKR